MKHLITILIFILCSLNGLCCECEPISISQGYYMFDFLAIGKICKVYNPTKDSYFVDFKIDSLIKGDSVTTFKVYSTPENYFSIEKGDTVFYFTSCDMYLRENEKWILFASKDSSGIYGLDMCSPTKRFEKLTDSEIKIVEELNSVEDYIFPSYELDLPILLAKDRILFDTILIKNPMFDEISNLTVRIDEYGKLIKQDINTLTDFQKIGFDYLLDMEPFEPGTINGNKVKSEYYLTIKTKK